MSVNAELLPNAVLDKSAHQAILGYFRHGRQYAKTE
ncbi:hypothetical protein LRU_00866 [Ligilactobacillus ruminis SPM0211]|uniref:Uncharacterized protein n=1 Tax=Ligilactobacillus ruminis SPM0211 TaxID=1040964 RepID=F7QZL0_9LACO|nr:hypothetical protein LRU_00866 [Ligilactobacillus ruminis SPM0211]